MHKDLAYKDELLPLKSSIYKKHEISLLNSCMDTIIDKLNNLYSIKVTNMYSMFYSTGSRATSINYDLSGWSTSNVTNMYCMFYYAGKNVTTYAPLDLSNWNVQKVTSHNSFSNRTPIISSVPKWVN